MSSRRVLWAGSLRDWLLVSSILLVVNAGARSTAASTFSPARPSRISNFFQARISKPSLHSCKSKLLSSVDANVKGTSTLVLSAPSMDVSEEASASRSTAASLVLIATKHQQDLRIPQVS
jgi:hypothetical protein